MGTRGIPWDMLVVLALPLLTLALAAVPHAGATSHAPLAPLAALREAARSQEHGSNREGIRGYAPEADGGGLRVHEMSADAHAPHGARVPCDDIPCEHGSVDCTIAHPYCACDAGWAGPTCAGALEELPWVDEWADEPAAGVSGIVLQPGEWRYFRVVLEDVLVEEVDDAGNTTFVWDQWYGHKVHCRMAYVDGAGTAAGGGVFTRYAELSMRKEHAPDDEHYTARALGPAPWKEALTVVRPFTVDTPYIRPTPVPQPSSTPLETAYVAGVHYRRGGSEPMRVDLAVDVVRCEGNCSGAGECVRRDDMPYTYRFFCHCHDGFTGADCSIRVHTLHAGGGMSGALGFYEWAMVAVPVPGDAKEFVARFSHMPSGPSVPFVLIRRGAPPTQQHYDDFVLMSAGSYVARDPATGKGSRMGGTWYVGVWNANFPGGANEVDFRIDVDVSPCLFNCSGHGACVHGACVCDTGYVLGDCSDVIPIAPMSVAHDATRQRNLLRVFRLELPAPMPLQSLALHVRAAENTGAPIFYVRRGAPPTASTFDFVADQRSLAYADLLLCSSQVEGGTWFVGVASQRADTMPFSLSVTYHARCFLGCSEHGVCNEATGECSCVGNYTGAVCGCAPWEIRCPPANDTTPSTGSEREEDTCVVVEISDSLAAMAAIAWYVWGIFFAQIYGEFRQRREEAKQEQAEEEAAARGEEVAVRSGAVEMTPLHTAPA